MAKGASKPGKAIKKVATVDKKAKKAAKKAKQLTFHIYIKETLDLVFL